MLNSIKRCNSAATSVINRKLWWIAPMFITFFFLSFPTDSKADMLNLEVNGTSLELFFTKESKKAMFAEDKEKMLEMADLLNEKLFLWVYCGSACSDLIKSNGIKIRKQIILMQKEIIECSEECFQNLDTMSVIY